ncbi:relaxase/mobilization nuclease domain-containing protein [Streptomyces sp. NPDC056132]|uniref:relaxase/mobilization nuclease domain-containing protein n=1 Tax=Streptomyces sp. NPDC056132 TaxID=3345722 RepID=UPI0035E191D1
MIGNVTKGRRARGAILYDYGPGRRDEHVNPRQVAGNVTGTPLQMARMMDHHIKRSRPEIKSPIWRVSLSLPDEDGVLSDAQFAAIADRFIAEMGFDGAPWIAVRHGDDHIHLTVSRVDWSGRLLSDQYDYARVRAACDLLEEEHGLVRARDRFRAEGPMVRNQELQASQRRGSEVPEREQLRALVREVRDASRGLGRDAFESGLADAGVEFRANVASTGRMNGYSFTLPGWTDPAGEPVWVTASKVARDLRWAELGRALGDGPVASVDRRAAAAMAISPAVTTPAEVEVEAEDLQLPSQRIEELTESLRRGRIERGTALPEDHPALSTDPARRIFEQHLARARGEEVPEQPQIPVQPVPKFDDKRRRPYGTLSHEKLRKEIAATRKALSAHRKAKTSAEETMRRWDARVTGQITGGDAETKLLARKAKVESAEPHLLEAQAQQRIVETTEQALTSDRAVYREASQLKGLGRVALWRQGTNSKQETQRADDAAARIHTGVQQLTTAQRRWSQAHHQAVQAAGVPDPARELNTLRANWDMALRQARGDDQAVAVSAREAARGRATSYDGYARKAEGKLSRLEGEAELRRTMPDGQRKAEGRARSDAALAQLTQKKAAASKKPARRGYPSPYGKGAGASATEQPYHLRNPQPGPKGPGMER